MTADPRIAVIRQSIQRAAALTGKLLRFARTDTQESTVTNLNDLIVEIDNLISRSVTPAVSIEHQFAKDLWSVLINPGDS